jgi:hypothetical protein
MMITFSVFLAVIFICELAGGIAAYVLRNDVDVTLTENMYKAQQQYNVTGHEGVTETWNIMQNEGKRFFLGNAKKLRYTKGFFFNGI